MIEIELGEEGHFSGQFQCSESKKDLSLTPDKMISTLSEQKGEEMWKTEKADPIR